MDRGCQEQTSCKPRRPERRLGHPANRVNFGKHTAQPAWHGGHALHVEGGMAHESPASPGGLPFDDDPQRGSRALIPQTFEDAVDDVLNRESSHQPAAPARASLRSMKWPLLAPRAGMRRHLSSPALRRANPRALALVEQSRSAKAHTGIGDDDPISSSA